jgi:hypothetical protein
VKERKEIRQRNAEYRAAEWRDMIQIQEREAMWEEEEVCMLR